MLVHLLGQAPGGAVGGGSGRRLPPHHPTRLPLRNQLPQLLHLGPGHLQLALRHLPSTCILALCGANSEDWADGKVQLTKGGTARLLGSLTAARLSVSRRPALASKRLELSAQQVVQDVHDRRDIALRLPIGVLQGSCYWFVTGLGVSDLSPVTLD